MVKCGNIYHSGTGFCLNDVKMTIIYSNVVSVTVSGAQYTYQLQLSISPSTLPSSGGSATATATLTTNPSGGPVSGYTVTLNQLSSNSTSATVLNTWTATTNSSGVATFNNLSFPANNTSTPDTYYFDAVVTV
jgi:hypothetical protein